MAATIYVWVVSRVAGGPAITRPAGSHPTVCTEPVYLRAQRAKKRASDMLNGGDAEAALKEIRQARTSAPEALAADLAEE